MKKITKIEIGAMDSMDDLIGKCLLKINELCDLHNQTIGENCCCISYKNGISPCICQCHSLTESGESFEVHETSGTKPIKGKPLENVTLSTPQNSELETEFKRRFDFIDTDNEQETCVIFNNETSEDILYFISKEKEKSFEEGKKYIRDTFTNKWLEKARQDGIVEGRTQTLTEVMGKMPKEIEMGDFEAIDLYNKGRNNMLSYIKTIVEGLK